MIATSSIDVTLAVFAGLLLALWHFAGFVLYAFAALAVRLVPNGTTAATLRGQSPVRVAIMQLAVAAALSRLCYLLACS